MLRWSVYLVCAVLAALWLAWWTLAQIDFLYPFWYEVLDIDQTIREYGPQNRYRPGFEMTAKAEHSRLFAAIVDAIHAQGQGLAELQYHDRSGQVLGHLLRTPEIVHLQDVARLIAILRLLGWGAVVLSIGLTLYYRARAYRLPTLMRLLAGLVAALVVAAMLIWLTGPVEVFYTLHTIIFPAGHQWFFYYQESLMTMLMKAPDLFGGIAIALVFIAIVYLAGLLYAARFCLNRSASK